MLFGVQCGSYTCPVGTCPFGVSVFTITITTLHCDGMEKQPASSPASTQHTTDKIDPHSSSGERRHEVAVAVKKSREPIWNRLRSRPGWFAQQVHMLRGLKPRPEIVPACAKGVHNMRAIWRRSVGVGTRRRTWPSRLRTRRWLQRRETQMRHLRPPSKHGPLHGIARNVGRAYGVN